LTPDGQLPPQTWADRSCLQVLLRRPYYSIAPKTDCRGFETSS
jgi:hypothetical protein